MRSLSDTLTRLSAYRSLAPALSHSPDKTRLRDFTVFGSNPGALGAKVCVPAGLEPGAALVVVLHGCTQTAAAYDKGSGWSALAERNGFALLYPEQQRSNNPALCFNWFAPDDARRGGGEAASIMQMIAALTAANGLDTKRVFITGLSAGGAMAAVMLAAYPEAFAAGAIFAGLPFGAARSVPEAFDRMRGHRGRDAADFAAAVRDASEHQGEWPEISIWHGTADQTVAPSNSDDLAAQWRGVHGLGAMPSDEEAYGSYKTSTWRDASGRVRVRHYAVRGMGHGVPIDAASGVGSSGPYMIETGVSATSIMAQSWGLLQRAAPISTPENIVVAPAPRLEAITPSAGRRPEAPAPTPTPGLKKNRVREIIEDALRKAGLM